MRLIILGCGTSTGVPRIGDDWGDCDPAEPRNRRTRSSILVEHEGFRILVDTGPDLRQQLLDNHVDDLDAVIWTHDHADHCHGIDELRQLFFHRRSPLPGHGSARTLEALQRRFGYAFEGNRGYPAIASAIELAGTAEIGPFRVRSVEQPHGPITSTGLRFEAGGRAVGYAIDFASVSDDMVELYGEVDILVADCLRREPHPTHAHFPVTMELIRRTGAKQTYLSHMDKSMDYRTLLSELPPGVAPAHDGLEISP